METYLILGVSIIGFLIVIFWFNKRLTDLGNNQKPSAELLDVIRLLSESSSIDRQELNRRLENTTAVISQLQRSLGEVSEIGRSMKDFSEFFKSPKLRGNIGEQILKELLGEFLPHTSFNLQYTFKSGEKVDAAIKTAGGIIPIDSKFPMENFKKMAASTDDQTRLEFSKVFEKDVRNHIDSISKKYILPQEGTIDYALMYIPSEAVYYEIVNSSNLFDYSHSKRVLPVSPTTFYAYLKAILMSFEGQKIEAKAKEILSSLRAIQKDYEKVEENLGVLQRHLLNASNMFSSVMSSFSHLGQKISSVKQLKESKNG